MSHPRSAISSSAVVFRCFSPLKFTFSAVANKFHFTFKRFVTSLSWDFIAAPESFFVRELTCWTCYEITSSSVIIRERWMLTMTNNLNIQIIRMRRRHNEMDLRWTHKFLESSNESGWRS